MAVIAGTAAPASAADTYLFLSDIDGHSLGYMVHLDDPDNFKVCDSRADGHGVTGKLYMYQQTGWAHKETITDGGDATCDYVHYNVMEVHLYLMKICWNGPGGICASRKFYE